MDPANPSEDDIAAFKAELKWYAESTFLTLVDPLLLALLRPVNAPFLTTRILTLIVDMSVIGQCEDRLAAITLAAGHSGNRTGRRDGCLSCISDAVF